MRRGIHAPVAAALGLAAAACLSKPGPPGGPGDPDGETPLDPLFGDAQRVMVTDLPQNSYATDPTLPADETWLVYAVEPIPGLTPAPPRQLNAATSAAPLMWETPVPIEEAFDPVTPKLAPDGTWLLHSEYGDSQLRSLTRDPGASDVGGPWTSAPSDVVGLDGDQHARPGTPTADLRRIMVYRREDPSDGPYQLYEYRRDPGEPWVEVTTSLGAIEAAMPFPAWNKQAPHLSPDGLALVFAAREQAVNPDTDLYLATRTTLDTPFEPARHLVEISDPELSEGDPWLSATTWGIYFSRSYHQRVRDSEWGIYYATPAP